MKKVLLSILACMVMMDVISQDSHSQVMLTLENYIYTGKKEIGALLGGQGRSIKVGQGGKYLVIRKGRLSLTAAGEQEILKNRRLHFSLAMKESGHAVEKQFTLLADDFHKNPVVAHRGAWKNSKTPENSIAALQHAITLGCSGSEFDVHMTADDTLVVNHDPGYRGKNIEGNSYQALAGEPLENGEVLPTLRNYLLAGMKQQSTRLVVEVKPSDKGRDRALARARKVLELVHELGAQAWVLYISFDFNILEEIRRLDPSAHLQYLNGTMSPQELKNAKMDGADYHFSVFQRNEHWIREAKDLGLQLNAWTVNDSNMLQYFLSRKFDFITTNEPELLFREWKK